MKRQLGKTVLRLHIERQKKLRGALIWLATFWIPTLLSATYYAYTNEMSVTTGIFCVVTALSIFSLFVGIFRYHFFKLDKLKHKPRTITDCVYSTVSIDGRGIESDMVFFNAKKGFSSAIVTWDAVNSVVVLTTGGGPAQEDMFFMIFTDNSMVGIPNSQAMKLNLMTWFGKNLGWGFSEAQTIAHCSGVAYNAEFPIWKREKNRLLMDVEGHPESL